MPNNGLLFVSELNLTLLAGNDKGRYYEFEGAAPGTVLMNARHAFKHLERLAMVDHAFGVRVAIEASQPARWKFEPVETVSQSESGFDRMYQGSNIWICFPLRGATNGTARFTVTLTLEKL